MRVKTTAVLGLVALVGCTLTGPGLRQDGPAPTIGGGRLIKPKLCALRVMILDRPAGDPVLDDVVWREADLQAVDDTARRRWEANGLRIGRLQGDLPAEVRALLDARSPERVDPVTIVLPHGDSTLVKLGPTVDQVSLFLNRDDKGPIGKVYRDANAHLRLVPSYHDAGGVALRVVPEAHHGPVQQGWAPAPGGAFEERRFVPKNGQQEETFRDLAATLTLQPGQVAVLGGLPGRPAGLGEFLFTEPEPTSDRPRQKVVLVWATRSESESAGPADLTPVEPAVATR